MDDSGNDFYYDDNYQLLTTECVCVCGYICKCTIISLGNSEQTDTI